MCRNKQFPLSIIISINSEVPIVVLSDDRERLCKLDLTASRAKRREKEQLHSKDGGGVVERCLYPILPPFAFCMSIAELWPSLEGGGGCLLGLVLQMLCNISALCSV